MSTDFVETFYKLLIETLKYTEIQIPEVKKKIKAALVKLQVAYDYCKLEVPRKFVKEVTPFLAELISENEDFFTKEAKTITIFKDLDIDLIYARLTPEVKKSFFLKVQNLYTFASTIVNNSTSSSEFEGVDESELGSTVQKILPAAMNMMKGMMGGKSAKGENPLAGMQKGGSRKHEDRKEQSLARLRTKLDNKEKAKNNLI